MSQADLGNIAELPDIDDGPCQCEAAGYCQKWQRYMNSPQHAACSRDPKMHDDQRNLIMDYVRNHPNPIQVPDGSTLPDMLARAKNFAKAAIHHASNQFARTSTDEKNRRLAICHQCEFLTRENNYEQCKACGCPIAKKVDWASESCPKSKWFEEKITHNHHIIDVPDDQNLLYDSNDIEGVHQISSIPTFYDADGVPSHFPNLKDRVVVMLGGGPSLEFVNLSKLPDEAVTYGLNNVAQIAKCDLWTCIDPPAAKFPLANWLDPEVHKVVPRGLAKEDVQPGIKVRDCPGVSYFMRNYRFRSNLFLTEPTFTVGVLPEGEDELGQGGGRSVMLPALKSLVAMGCTKIVILGADFHMDPNRPYAHHERKDDRGCATVNETFKYTNNRLMLIRPRLDMMGVRVINATHNSKLTAFEQFPLEYALQQFGLRLSP